MSYLGFLGILGIVINVGSIGVQLVLSSSGGHVSPALIGLNTICFFLCLPAGLKGWQASQYQGDPK